MKRFLLLLIFLLKLSGIPNAQQIYFNQRLNVGMNEDSHGIISNGNSYDLITASEGFGPGLKSVFVHIDSMANIQFQKVHGKNNFYNFSGGYSGLNRLKDSSYVYAGGIEDSVTDDVLLYKLSKDGDSIWVRQYGDSLFQSGWMCRLTRDGGFIITGQTNTYDSKGDMMLIKTDSSGIYLWQKHYGGSGYDIGISIDTCFDNGFIICGYTESFGINASVNHGNIYVVKTDSLGNIKWQKTFGGQYAETSWSCLQAMDGNYIVAGDTTYYDLLPNGGDEYSKPYILKIDTSGNVLWAKVYGPVIFNTGLLSIRETADNKLIAAGTTYDSSSNNRMRGLIIKTDSQGDSLWYRIFSNISVQHGDNALFDITPENDGGFAAFGTVYPLSPDTGTQDVWVLKIDSDGCEVMNCTLTSTGKIISGSIEEINVFPNPSRNIFHFKLSGEEDEIKRIRINNILGEEICTSIKTDIDLSGLSEGIYFYEVLTTGKRKLQGKLLKQ